MNENNVSEKTQDAELTEVAKDEEHPEAAADGELTNEELSGVTGGNVVGVRFYVDGGLYTSSYGEDLAGHISGYYYIQKYVSGRPAPILLDANVGWVKLESIKY